MAESTRYLDTSPHPKKRQRFLDVSPATAETLPAEWRALAVRWLRKVPAAGSRWETLTKAAGPADYPLAQRLLEWLLGAGWVVVTEERRNGAWWPTHVEFREVAELRTRLGLPDPGEPARQWATLQDEIEFPGHPDLVVAMSSLDGLPPARAIERARLLQAVARWRDDGRYGTRRDFAHFARGATKAITATEWRWLEDAVDLAGEGIDRHTPLLLVAAPLTLQLPDGIVALHCAPDFAGLTPATVAAVSGVSGRIAHWRLIENKTSFERCARSREADTAVVWLPGFPPTWWRETMSRLIALAPAPAEIACDPDPAGIAIALETAKLWDAAQLDWRPWRMDFADLANLSRRAPLTPADCALLDGLLSRPVPDSLMPLAKWIADHGEKGEQEGYL